VYLLLFNVLVFNKLLYSLGPRHMLINRDITRLDDASGVARGGPWGPWAPGGTWRGAAPRWPKINFWKQCKCSSFSLLF